MAKPVGFSVAMPADKPRRAVFQGAATRGAALLFFVLVAGVSAGHAHAADDGLRGEESTPGEEGMPVEEGAVADRLMHAFGLIGTRYHRRGVSPQTGFDCSGFIGWIFRAAHDFTLPRTAHEMFSLATGRAESVERERLAPGDLVFFRIGRLGKRIDHVGIYTGEGRFIHAPARGGAVRIDTLELAYWQKHYAGARRLHLPALRPGGGADQQTLSQAMQDGAAAGATTSESTTPGELPP